MNVESEIRQHLRMVAANELSVWEFERWLEPFSWSMYRDRSDVEINLIRSIQSIFAQFDYESVDESALREALSFLVRNAVMEIVINAPSRQDCG